MPTTFFRVPPSLQGVERGGGGAGAVHGAGHDGMQHGAGNGRKVELSALIKDRANVSSPAVFLMFGVEL